MFVADLFEKQNRKSQTVVIMPGGFHPWHPGHSSLYASAVQTFPEADVYVVSTDDTKTRPFPFNIKQQLAAMAGVPADRFIQVKSPFQATEIRDRYDDDSTVLIFVRSQKDITEHPKPGGVKKDGTPAYLQPYGDDLEPMSQHAYMAYLPTVEFRAGRSGVTSATEIRNLWPRADDQTKQQIVADLYPNIANNPRAMDRAVSLLDQALAAQLAESSDERIHDPRQQYRIRKARQLYPTASSDEEALYMYSTDLNRRDLDRIDQENQEQEQDIEQNRQDNDRQEQVLGLIQDLEQDLQAQIDDLQNQIGKIHNSDSLREEAAGVGVVASASQARDPRYSMSLTHDVRPDTPRKNLEAFGLLGKPRKSKRSKQ